MTTFHAKDATIEISSDGEHWHRLSSFAYTASWDLPAHPTPLHIALDAAHLAGFVGAAALSRIPYFQEQAAAAARAEEERLRMDRLAALPIWHSLSCTITKFNRGMFEALGGAHTRQSMRHRKIARYIRGVRNQ